MTDRPSHRVLMIAYCFPPAGGIVAAGSQRALKFAKNLPFHQWEPIVLTVKQAYYESYISMDYDLLEELPEETKIVRTSAIRLLTKALELKNNLKLKFAFNKNNSNENVSTEYHENTLHQK